MKPSPPSPHRRALAFLLGLCACGGGIYVDGNVPTTVPSITSFTAMPAALDADGGSSALVWTVQGANGLTLQPGPGDVSNLTTWHVVLTATTTYTLTAYNSFGNSSANLTVTVGP